MWKLKAPPCSDFVLFALGITFRGALYYSFVNCTSAAVLIEWNDESVKLVFVSRSRATMAHSA